MQNFNSHLKIRICTRFHYLPSYWQRLRLPRRSWYDKRLHDYSAKCYLPLKKEYQVLFLACTETVQFKGLGIPSKHFATQKCFCIDENIACNNYEASQCAFQIWKSFCSQDRPFLSSTWSGRLFFFLENFRVCIRSKQGKPVPTRNFWIRFYKSEFKNACWVSPKPDIQHKIALTVHLIL